MHRNQEKLGNNPRTAMVFKNWLKKTDEQREAVLNQAETYLENINNI
jgi:deoxyribodipyrimidine photolyase-related protein